MGAVQKLMIDAPGISLEEQADRAVGTMYSFIAVQMSMAEQTKFPDTYAELRDILVEGGANFSMAPPPEVLNSPDYVHESFVPETYEEFKVEILRGLTERISRMSENYSEIYQLLDACEEVVPENEYEFLIQARRAWLSWTDGAVFALEHIAPEMGGGPVMSGGIEDLIAMLTGEAPQ